jgi:glycosyltransferase involved in cell wall biosynthesis
VAIVLPTHWSVAMGGAEYQCKLLSEHLLSDGRFEVHCLSKRVAVDTPQAGYITHCFGRQRQLAARAYFLDALALWRTLDAVRPDVIYQRGASGLTWASARWARNHSVRLVWHAAADVDLAPSWGWAWLRRPMSGLDRLFARQGVRRAHAVVVQKKEQQVWAATRLGRGDAVVIPNFHPVPLAVSAAGSQPKSEKNQPTVVWIANFKTLKRPEHFVELARQLSDGHTQFLMMGSPSGDAAYMHRFEQSLQGVGGLRYFGSQTQAQVNRWLERASLLVNTSDYEGFSNTFIQAWMRGVPVISLNANPDGLLDGERCGLCAGGSMATLIRQTRSALADTAWRARVGAAAAQWSSAYFGTDNARALAQLLLAGVALSRATAVPHHTQPGTA